MNRQQIVVLQIIDGFATEEASGGAAQFGIQLARHLDASKYRPHVCGLWRYGTDSERRWRATLADEGIETSVLIDRRGRLALDMMRAARRLHSLLSELQPQILNSHFERGDLLSLFGKLVHSTHPHIVRTMHADQQWQTRPWLGTVMNFAAFPWLFDAEVAISRATKRHMDSRLAARVRRRRATLIYNGISPEFLCRVRRDSARTMRTGAPRLGIIGRLERQKGHTYLLEAMRQVLDEVPAAEVWVVGTGSLREPLEQQARELDVAHAVQFLGQRSDIPDILDQLDLLVSASIWEGFPTVILEAMAARLPVVATDVSGSRELVQNEETGLLVPMRAPDRLARAILWMIRQPDAAQRMADNAWRNIQAYTLDSIASRYDDVYSGILN